MSGTLKLRYATKKSHEKDVLCEHSRVTFKCFTKDFDREKDSGGMYYRPQCGVIFEVD